MFFNNNKNLLIGTGCVAILWIVLYYVFVVGNWNKAQESIESAQKKRKAWELRANDADERKANPSGSFKPRSAAEAELAQASAQTEQKLVEARQVEFGTAKSLVAFSVEAKGAGADISSLLNTRIKETTIRANNIIKGKKIAESDLATRFREDGSSDALNLLRLAMVDRFLSACKEVKDVKTNDCKIEEIRGIEYYEPKVNPPPDPPKPKEKKSVEEEGGEAKKAVDKATEKNKDKPGVTGKPIDPLVQIPMKVSVCGTEQYITQLLFELSKPTPSPPQSGPDQRGYFCLKSFQLTVSKSKSSSGEQLVELSVVVSALMTESELAKLKIDVKSDAPGGGGGRRELRD